MGGIISPRGGGGGIVPLGGIINFERERRGRRGEEGGRGKKRGEGGGRGGDAGG